MSTDSLFNVYPPPEEWISMQITNARRSGTIVVRDPSLNSGEFLDDYPTEEHHYGTVHNRSIHRGRPQIISASASKGYRGTSGSIHLFERSTLICTLYWDCPGGREQNSLQHYNVNDNYSISIGTFNRRGPIGEVDITIRHA